jgi:hypothetical protein
MTMGGQFEAIMVSSGLIFNLLLASWTLALSGSLPRRPVFALYSPLGIFPSRFQGC